MTNTTYTPTVVRGYADLDPDRVLRTLDALGLRGDGRMLQLNSYENRVFQVFLEDGDVVVAKFYRPARWSDEQILEEHAFARELAAEDVPVVAPRVLAGVDSQAGIELLGNPPTLAHWRKAHALHRVAVSDRYFGRGAGSTYVFDSRCPSSAMKRLLALQQDRRITHSILPTLQEHPFQEVHQLASPGRRKRPGRCSVRTARSFRKGTVPSA